MAPEPRALLFMNYHSHFWDGAVKVDKDDIEIGDIFVIAGHAPRRSGWPADPVEARVLSVNDNDTATVMVRGGDIESVRLDLLRQPKWSKVPQFYMSYGPRSIPFYRRPTHKDDMLKHGVAVTRLDEYDDDGNLLVDEVYRAQRIDTSDFMMRDYFDSIEATRNPPILNRLNLRL